MTYKPTGFPLGRPRTGEMRPQTPRTIWARKQYLALKDNPEFQEQRRAISREHYWKDPERAAFLQKKALQRKRAWAQGGITGKLVLR